MQQGLLDRFPEINESKAGILAQQNFYRLYFEKVRRSRFVDQVSPEFVLEKLGQILRAEMALEKALSDGKELLIRESPARYRGPIAKRIRQNASLIHNAFRSCLVENGSPDYSLEFYRIPWNSINSVSFFIKSAKIAACSLTRSLGTSSGCGPERSRFPK